jgi:hypothetical protein
MTPTAMPDFAPIDSPLLVTSSVDSEIPVELTVQPRACVVADEVIVCDSVVAVVRGGGVMVLASALFHLNTIPAALTAPSAPVLVVVLHLPWFDTGPEIVHVPIITDSQRMVDLKEYMSPVAPCVWG